MNYKVIPFVPSLDHKNRSGEAAAVQLSNVINKHAEEGWEYVRLESVTSWVAPESGCFGLGTKAAAYTTSRQMIVFKKRE